MVGCFLPALLKVSLDHAVILLHCLPVAFSGVIKQGVFFILGGVFQIFGFFCGLNASVPQKVLGHSFLRSFLFHDPFGIIAAALRSGLPNGLPGIRCQKHILQLLPLGPLDGGIISAPGLLLCLLVLFQCLVDILQILLHFCFPSVHAHPVDLFQVLFCGIIDPVLNLRPHFLHALLPGLLVLQKALLPCGLAGGRFVSRRKKIFPLLFGFLPGLLAFLLHAHHSAVQGCKLALDIFLPGFHAVCGDLLLVVVVGRIDPLAQILPVFPHGAQPI